MHSNQPLLQSCRIGEALKEHNIAIVFDRVNLTTLYYLWKDLIEGKLTFHQGKKYHLLLDSDRHVARNHHCVGLIESRAYHGCLSFER